MRGAEELDLMGPGHLDCVLGLHASQFNAVPVVRSLGSLPTCSPFTKVPFLLPRSDIQNPSESLRIAVCCPDTPSAWISMSLNPTG